MAYCPSTLSHPSSCSSASTPYRSNCFPHLQSVAAPKAFNTSKAASPSLRSPTEAGTLRPRVSASAIATHPPTGKAATPVAPVSAVSPELPDTPMPQAEQDATTVDLSAPAAATDTATTATHSPAPTPESLPSSFFRGCSCGPCISTWRLYDWSQARPSLWCGRSGDPFDRRYYHLSSPHYPSLRRNWPHTWSTPCPIASSAPPSYFCGGLLTPPLLAFYLG